MKRKVILLLLFFSTSFCYAYDCIVDGTCYNISSGEEMIASVTFRSVKTSNNVNKDYSSPYSGTVVIPSSIMVSDVQYTVTSIGDHAFEDCCDLESIVLPESITVLGESAFQESGLQTIELPATINTIGRSAFYHCNNLKNIEITEGVKELGPDVFRHCSSLVSVRFSENCVIEEISLWAFQDCNNLQSINLPENLKEINNEAFAGCISLKKISFPNSLLRIGQDAFQGCISLDSLIIPAKVETIVGNPVSVEVGSAKVALPVCMKNTVDIRGLQFDLYLPDGVTIEFNKKGKFVDEPVFNEGRLPEDDEHTIQGAVQPETGAVRFLINSQYDETFTGNDGLLFTVTANLASDMAVGEYPIIMKDIKLSENDINKYYTTSTVKTTLNVTNMTVVNGIVGNKAADGIYNLNGQKLEVIQRGINITEGKKILVK